MIEVDEALTLCLAEAGPLQMVRVPLEDALDNVLAEDVSSDVDSPPHDKSLVDGYAVVANDVGSGKVELEILEEITAGDCPTKPVRPGTATRIMTGAPIPAGADAVVMVEQTKSGNESNDPPTVLIHVGSIVEGQHIMRRATSLHDGQVVLSAGRVIRSAEIGLLAEVGQSNVPVIRRPTVSILATGNELVPASDRPGAGQIRNSNSPMLSAAVRKTGGEPNDLGIGRDDESELTHFVQKGLKSDVLLLSGGVSMGVLDLIPKVLSRSGVQQVFHKVRLKPGKPLWFGVLPSEDGNRLVFGLPGNPVSGFVCFELFVRPVILALAGHTRTQPSRFSAQLSQPHTHRGDRPTYWPAKLVRENGQGFVEPLDWRGSADLRTLAEANCLAFFPAGDRVRNVGDCVQVQSI
ncbi:MAG: molybdopterin molybdotransferase MoeA [Planctomycetes bacterium]|nr:molybdopterin molybdotransferase MoeA [Planctomycetota bacterium]